MDEIYIPTGPSETEFTEKRSRFIGRVFHVQTEEEARACIEQVKKRHHDARHSCWCYRLRDGVERYSDDGEPQGTAGQPMLNVFQREKVTDVCCVVTRYFGGVLLGAGGLVRAYAKSAKDALDAAGISVVRPWARVSVPCPYPLLERIRLETAAHGGVIDEIIYTEQAEIRALLPLEGAEAFQARVTELSAGQIQAAVTGQAEQAVPLCPDG